MPDILTLREIQLSELAILDSFSSFCDSHALTYSLGYGTLLGAVRHKGFIPWDDDVDVCMPRPDYERFLMLSADYRHETGYEVMGFHGIDSSISPFVKICNTGVVVEAPDLLQPEYLWVDVFPVDGMEADEGALRRQCRWFEISRLMLAALTSPVSSAKGVKRKLVKAIFRFCGLFISKERVAASVTDRAKRISFEGSEFAGHLVHTPYGVRERQPSCSFSYLVELTFEGHRFKALNTWGDYLTSIYGDYMTPPPVGDRVSHKITAYRAEQDKKDQ